MREIECEEGRFCWGCQEGVTTYHSKTPRDFFNLMTMIRIFAYAVTPGVMVNNIHWWYTHYVRNAHRKRNKKDPGDWSKEMIFKHIFEHTMDMGL